MRKLLLSCLLTACLSAPLHPLLAGGGGASDETDLSGANIVLAHGILGWDDDNPDGTFFNQNGLAYWGGIDDHLRSQGAQVMTDGKSALAHSYVRATQLRDQINYWLASRGVDNEQVHIFGHSQGGIDARILASPGGLGGLSNAHGNRIATLTTVSAPHYGTTFADVYLGYIHDPRALDFLAGIVNGIAGLVYNGEYIFDHPEQDVLGTLFMAVNEMALFNRNFVDEPGVGYFSTGGEIRGWNILQHNPLLLPFYLPNEFGGNRVSSPQIGLIGSRNDGAVPVRSMRWGTWIGGPEEYELSSGIDHLAITNAFHLGQLWYDFEAYWSRLAANAKANAP